MKACTIYLHGEARRRFGPKFTLTVNSPAEAVRALSNQLRGFEAFVRSAEWKIFRGPIRKRDDAGEEELALTLGRCDELHFAPIPVGAKKSGGIGKIVAGVAIAVAAVLLSIPTGGGSIALGATAFTVFGAEVTFGSIALIGAGMLLTGVSQLLTATPKISTGGYSQRDAPDNRASFLFNGPVNVTEQGNPIPVAAGLRVRTGSIVISAGIFTERVPTNDDDA